MNRTFPRLEGKKAIVTGGSSGIGRAIALAYAREGADVAILSRSDIPHEGGRPTQEVIRAAGGAAFHISVDVEDSAALEKAVDDAVAGLGGLHIMTTSAGILGPMGDSREIDLAEFDRNFAVNVRGSFVAIRTALRHFAAQRYGRVVAVGSNFDRVGIPQFATYCMSKGAITNMTRALAIEYGSYGITINTLAPGSTKTAMAAASHDDPAIAAAFRAATPLALPDNNYQAEPEDIANGAVFLASDEARFMTGASLVIDGGWTAR